MISKGHDEITAKEKRREEKKQKEAHEKEGR